ncbi:hypothetical protein [Petroclostridium sp. X23]|uniref:hypothetical protein n=1 Tax=Petroclostridium sp. X23 TaxID=3045146 RepID=UPI0024ADF73D|nr:hypothetical protein [Petroclostridium sp. X23]WHH59122.1 hypothetical protein QKW49_25610 [Petroclostridium sp. X23]
MCVVAEIRETVESSPNLSYRIVEEKAGLGNKVIYKITSHEKPLRADAAFSIAHVVDNPNIVRKYCHENCIIGQSLELVPLNNVDLSMNGILVKCRREGKEFYEILEDLEEVCLNKKSAADYSKNEEDIFFSAFHEMLDVLHCCQELVAATIRKWGLRRVITEIQKHNQKCRSRGYVKSNETLQYV